jgi:Na+-driven multidrug efflux pump
MNLLLITTLLWSIAFGIATQITVAHGVGSGNYDGADRALRRSLKITVLGNLALSLLLAVFHPYLLQLLTSDSEVIEIARPLFWISPLVEMGRAMNIVTGGALRASGDARFASFVSPLFMWGIGVPLCFAMVHAGFGLTGIWVGLAVDELCRGGMNYWRWRTGRWRSLSVI